MRIPLLVAAIAVLVGVAVLQGSRQRSRPADASTAICSPENDLSSACRQAADWLRRQLGPECHQITHPPLVVAGDLPESELELAFRVRIEPVVRAMAAQFFARRPSEPITVLLFSNEPTYRRYAAELFGDREVSALGYYRPHLRTILWNAGRGLDALGHELTHALMAFDFPESPEWFSEGLASLYETARLRADGSGLAGERNWRLEGLHAAIRDRRLPPLESLLGSADFHGYAEGLNYAHARYFCMYLQQQGVLSGFYRRLRETVRNDPTGERALAAVAAGRSLAEIDADFRAWAAALPPCP